MSDRNNVVLIGMPGSGKSTVGVLLAKSLLKDFADTDLIIQKNRGTALCNILQEKGVQGFIELENEIISHCSFTNCVVATGGSAVYGKKAMENLRENSVIIYLSVPCDELEKRIHNIHTRGIAMESGTTIKELFCQRKALYETYADITVDCMGLTAEECVNLIVGKLKNHKSL